MRRSVILGFVSMLGASAAFGEERRELGAHEHGHSTLNIAIEGTRVAMELAAPGMDIVGFEHAAETEEQKAAVETGKRTLADPLALFVLPPAAGCRLAAAKVKLGTESQETKLGAGESHTEDHSAGEEGHTEFHAEYALDCTNPSALGSITFAFFEHFPQADEIKVTLISERGQKTFEVERAQPRLALGDLT
jgi:hypothetical protein